MKKFRTVQAMANAAEEDENLAEALRRDPINTLRASANPFQDVWIYRIVAGVLGLIGLSSVVSSFVLAGMGAELPQGGLALGATAVGALAGLLVPSGPRE